MTQIFGELDHRISLIPRWQILHTIQKQNLSTHVHNVERIAYRVALLWLGKSDPEELLSVFMWAHHHDDDEVLTGDIQGPAKHYFEKDQFTLDHAELFPVQHPMDWVIECVKLADLMEWVYFLKMEVALGNQFVTEQAATIQRKTLKYALTHFGAGIRDKANDWIVNIDPKSRNYNKGWE